jgi:hypothetical protein
MIAPALNSGERQSLDFLQNNMEKEREREPTEV